MAPNLAFRPDIDGLRAVAVLAVVLFHAGAPGFDGGFVGVDVFFVISGFLITQRVVASREAGDFTFGHFYARRARRLLPAAATTLLATLAAGVVLLEPADVVRLARSGVAAAFSASNVLFWSEAGYWDAAATSKPLLHTWSLAVEEQFYLLWPLLLIGLLAWRGRGAIVPLLGIGVVSLALTWWFTGVDAAGAFYLMPFRVYEFVAGAAIVWLDRRTWPATRAATTTRAALWLVGLAAILGSIALYDGATVFPGVAAAVPAFGTAAVIMARRPATLDRVLSNAVAGQVGLRSYSLYLTHWPVLVFAAVIHGPLDGGATLTVLGLSVVLAELQFRFVERPMRWTAPRTSAHRARRVNTRAAAPGVAAMVLVAIAGAGAMAGNSPGALPASAPPPTAPVQALDREEVLPEPPDERLLRSVSFEAEMSDRSVVHDQLCDAGKIAAASDTPFCGAIDSNATNVVVLGDSHTLDAVNALLTAAPELRIIVPEDRRGGCPPLHDLEGLEGLAARDGQSGRVDCSVYNEGRFDVVDSIAPDLDVIVLSMLIEEDYGDLDLVVEAFEETVAWMIDRWGVPIVVMGVGPYYEGRAFGLATRADTLDGFDAELNKGLRERIFQTDARLAASMDALGARYVSRLGWLCPDRACRALVPGQSRWMIYDEQHLTGAASRALGLGLRGPIRAALGLDPDVG